ncbi:hypothetical protein [Roseospira visakhapatnamensis]|uniref:Uncharacterized protein n=1 Tax=Roseospira visakhapatnamensis TaxID=390880 RepID=A0A7W6RG16_9PROT|nr:hypothetical protein [Roseospira visakhapatnamensis]MBB4267660.1 hypothetical protein [Roseospira visakhapatnamensis]
MEAADKTRAASRWLGITAPRGMARGMGLGLALSAATVAVGSEVAAGPAAVAPGDARAAVARAAERITAGQPAEAVDALREATLAVWSAAPLDLVMVSQATGQAEGYRDYEPREQGPYPAGEPLHLYIEPIGLQYEFAEGVYSMGLAADFLVLNGEGTILGGQRNFADFPFTFHVPSTAVYMTASFQTEGLPPADYLLQLTVRDTIGGGSVTRDVPFSITEP